jgi:hypothetical protein
MMIEKIAGQRDCASGRCTQRPDANVQPKGALEVPLMCRSIETLFHVEPPVTEDEIRAAALQFVRKISGFNKPSKANEAAFLAAVEAIAAASCQLLGALATSAPPKHRAAVAAKARARAAQRFAK